MSKVIPEHIDAFRFAEQNLRLEGVVHVHDMPRLCESLTDTTSAVTVDMQFGRDEQGLAYIKGHIETALHLQCQRCMEPFLYDIIANFMLGIVHNHEEKLPEQYEPVVVGEGELAVKQLIEDELILNLPLIPKHDPEQCKVKLPVVDSGWEEGGIKANPFHKLKSLKGKELKRKE